MSKSVSHIFGGEAKVKIMRLFIFNPEVVFSPSEVAHRAQERARRAWVELRILLKAGLIKRRARGFILNPFYLYLPAIENFLIDAAPITEQEIIRRLSKAGMMKLILISGVFLHNPDTRADILIVGDHIKNSKLISVIISIEAELGKELRYAVFETVDFQYRLGIYDKLIRDILESDHKKILNKLSI
ncbi:MAG: hypothetical protein HYS51_01210 [Candidatus Zambryskibacteria bacterium]|nr:hypothetical protein [Candidatus Zambryskibacteria bacterium]